MKCSLCGGYVEWKGPLVNLTHTECHGCGAINSQEVEDHSEEEPCEWLPMDNAPQDGTVIIGKYGNDGVAIRWAETRRCMLAGIGGGNGYFGAGWEDEYNGLIMDDPEAWMSEEDYQQNS